MDDAEIIYEKSLIGTVAEARIPPKYATSLSDPYKMYENVSPALLKKIEKLFEADFDLFGYSPLKAVEKSLLSDFSAEPNSIIDEPNSIIDEKSQRKERIKKILVEDWAMPKASLMRMKICHILIKNIWLKIDTFLFQKDFKD